IFLGEAAAANLKTLPYKSGFFITIPFDNISDEKMADKLKDENIFTIIIPGAIRLAICSIPKYKIYGLAQKIKNVISQI
ncbi:MAG: aspartate aminotransferase, partial [Fusobacteriaceae bacterium]